MKPTKNRQNLQNRRNRQKQANRLFSIYNSDFKMLKIVMNIRIMNEKLA